MASHRSYFPIFRTVIGGLLVAALIALLGARDGSVHAAGTFDSSTTYYFCNQLPSNFTGPAPLPGPNPGGGCAPDILTPSVSADWGFTFNVPPGDMNFSTFAVFLSDDFAVAADAAIADGTVVGGVTNSVSLGLTANPCNNILDPQFILYDATTDTSNTVNALAEGTHDRFSNLVTDGGDAFANVADADSPAVLKYPSFLNTLLDPDLDYPGGPNGPTPPISPHARYTGLTIVGNEWIFFSILVFEKSQLGAFAAHANNATSPLARYGENPDAAGWVYLLVLQDPSETVGAVSAISDFCSPINADAMFLGEVDTDGDTIPDTSRQTNPPAGTGIDGLGTHLMMLYGLSARDTDGDGLENTIDTCPFAANIDDPRVEGGGADPGSGGDLDMLDPACDPTPNAGTKYDPTNAEGGGTCADTIDNDGDTVADILDPDCHDGSVLADIDGDGYQNSQDNCPLAANAVSGSEQAEAEQVTPYIIAAPDAGFRTDSIGDACDSEGGGSDTVADGGFLHDMNTDAVCIGGTDTTPADGFCDGGGESSSTIDTDGDGFTNEKELFMQTDPLVGCSFTLQHQAWPPDFNNDKTINILDIVQLTPPTFGAVKGVDPEYLDRLDLNADAVINILDIVQLTPPAFGTSCTNWDATNQEDGDNLPTDGPPSECNDLLDNDADTLIDAADPDCQE